MTLETTLPATKTSATNGLAYTATAANSGTIIIDQKRAIAEYRVAEFPADGGRAFRFAKLEGGTDRTATAYNVLLADSRSGEFDSCDCKGFGRHGHCKHVDAAHAIVDRGLIRLTPPTPTVKPAPAAAQLAAPASPTPAAPKTGHARREYRADDGRRAALQFDYYPAATRFPFQVSYTPANDDMPKLLTPATLAAARSLWGGLERELLAAGLRPVV